MTTEQIENLVTELQEIADNALRMNRLTDADRCLRSADAIKELLTQKTELNKLVLEMMGTLNRCQAVIDGDACPQTQKLIRATLARAEEIKETP